MKSLDTNNINLQWLNPISQIKTDEILYETLLLRIDTQLLGGMNITCILDNENVQFKDTKSQKWTGDTNPIGRVNISIVSLKKYEKISFNIKAFLTGNPAILAPILPVEFIPLPDQIDSVNLRSYFNKISVYSFATLTATVKTKNGAPANGIKVNFNINGVDAYLDKRDYITNENGEVAAILTGIQLGNVTVTASASGDKSESVTITFVKDYDAAIIIAQPFYDISTNIPNYSDNVFNIDSGFPKMGFSRAVFCLAPTGNPDANKLFNWASSDPVSAPVEEDGYVYFLQEFSTATITATKKFGFGDFVFNIHIRFWFYSDKPLTKAEVQNYNLEYLPSSFMLTSGMKDDNTPKRAVGTLTGEWGDLRHYWDFIVPDTISDHDPKWNNMWCMTIFSAPPFTKIVNVSTGEITDADDGDNVRYMYIWYKKARN